MTRVWNDGEIIYAEDLQRYEAFGELAEQAKATAEAAANGIKRYATLAALNADLVPVAGTQADVDGDGANNGRYVKVGASGTGSWNQISTATLSGLDARATTLEATVHKVPLVSQGGLTDWFREVDDRGRAVLRMGAGHILAGTLRLVETADGSFTLSGAKGTILRKPASGGMIIPGRIGEGSYPGADLILRYANFRGKAYETEAATGYLKLIGRPGAGAVQSIITDAEFAALTAEAANYGDRLIRKALNLHLPTEGLVLWICYGQSLSTGQQSFPAKSRTPPPDCYMFGTSVHARNISDPVFLPMGGSPTLTPLVATVRGSTDNTLLNDAQVAALAPDAFNPGETPLEGFAAQLRTAWLRARGKAGGDPSNKWVFASCGVGGRTMAELQAGASPDLFQRFRDAVELGKSVAASLGVSFSAGGVLFNQGESDYSINTSYADYLAGGTQLFADMRSYVATSTSQSGLLPILIQQTGGNYTADDLQLAVGRAQLTLAKTIPGVTIVSNNGVYPDRGAHLGANGTQWYGTQMGKAASRVLVDRQNYQGAHVIRGVYRKNKLILLVHAPVPGLRFGSHYTGNTLAAQLSATHKGFYAEDSSGSVPITDVRLRDRLIEITFARDFVSAPTWWVGRRAAMNGVLSVTDSDSEHLVNAYTYGAGTGQWVEENITELVGLSYSAANNVLADVQAATAL